MSTVVPIGPLVGVNELIVGGGTSVNDEELTPVPFAVVTEIGPVVAPGGTFAEMDWSDWMLNCASVPLNVTEVPPVKLSPEIEMLMPNHPLVGENDAMIGVVVVVSSTLTSSKFAASEQ